AEPRLDVAHGQPARAKARLPEVERSGRNRERRDGDLARTLAAHRHAAPPIRKGRPDRAGRAVLVAVIEVVDVVIVEVDRFLHQAQAQRVQTEIQIFLCAVDGGRDVMKAEDRRRHSRQLFTSVAMLPSSEFRPNDGPNRPPRVERMNVLVSSSGSVATLPQKSRHKPSWLRYCSTFER